MIKMRRRWRVGKEEKKEAARRGRSMVAVSLGGPTPANKPFSGNIAVINLHVTREQGLFASVGPPRLNEDTILT